jgi:N utilization substance protein B
MGLRRKGREIVLQVLYSLDYNQDYPLYENRGDRESQLQILNNTLEGNEIKPDSRIRDFSRDLLTTIIENLIPIDEIIINHLEHWNIDRMAVLDRNLLRLAVAEIVFRNTPPPIVINEALEIAKKYCGDQTGRLLNGVLDQIVKNIDKEREEQNKN